MAVVRAAGGLLWRDGRKGRSGAPGTSNGTTRGNEKNNKVNTSDQNGETNGAGTEHRSADAGRTGNDETINKENTSDRPGFGPDPARSPMPSHRDQWATNHARGRRTGGPP